MAFPYAFRPERKTGREFVRVLGRISAQLGKLGRKRRASGDDAVHDIRTLIKLLRALLWFAQPGLPPAAVAYAKLELHNAARLLSARRDFVAMRGALEKLAGGAEDGPEREAVARAEKLLVRRAPKSGAAVLHRQQGRAVALVRKTVRFLIRAAAAAPHWKSRARRLDKARALARRARDAAEIDPAPALLHEWRKKVKRVLYLLQVFHARPGKKAARKIEEVDELQHRLGDHHDTVLLEDYFTRHHPEEAAAPELEPLFALLKSRQHHFRKQAGKSARKLSRL